MTFLCGDGSCIFVPDDPARDKYVEERRMAWTGSWEREHGEFPALDAQVAFMIKTEDEYDSPASRAQRHRKRLELAEIEARREYMRRSIPSLPQAQQGNALQHGSRCVEAEIYSWKSESGGPQGEE